MLIYTIVTSPCYHATLAYSTATDLCHHAGTGLAATAAGKATMSLWQ